MNEFMLVQDSDCHWYFIPADKEKDFCKWAELDAMNEKSWIPPGYAVRVGGCPSLVKFQMYRIDKNDSEDTWENEGGQ